MDSTIPNHQVQIAEYSKKTTPLLPMPKGVKPYTEEEAVRWLLDEAMKASKQLVHTHYKEDLARVVILAMTLNNLGYDLIWVKHKGCVGVHKKEVA